MSRPIAPEPGVPPQTGAPELAARRIAVTGIVQGVGFRPFVFNLAQRHGLGGWVLNTAFGVEIVAVGAPAALEAFCCALPAEAPPLAVLDQTDVEAVPLPGAPPPELVSHQASPLFTIRHSEAQSGDFVPISPDVALCEDCRRELLDPQDRRYRYPFTNCTNCGPRYTIIHDIPYDRPLTTMQSFAMCPACRAEYDDPRDRRFHAQPNACPDCGPRLRLELVDAHRDHLRALGLALSDLEGATGDAALLAAQAILAAGGIMAVKGLGGFHLACDATHAGAVAELRARKRRGAKPFAVMARDLAMARTVAHIDDRAAGLLTGRAHPILLLPAQAGSPLAPEVAPGAPETGVMLPYTPLHLLLLTPPPAPLPGQGPGELPALLVMTSGNLSEEPIVTGDQEARNRLAGLADALLLHDRPIAQHSDDSVLRPYPEGAVAIRRARGYAPLPIRLPFAADEILAVGAELKNTLCLTRGRYAFLSQHIGDMENLETLAAFEHTQEHMQRLFRCTPRTIAHDLHPGYLSTRWAEERAAAADLPRLAVQHHHAHLAALMGEHGCELDAQAIGVIFDGTGYGPDGTVWGGEILAGGYANFRRVGRLRPFPLPGGDAAIRRPYRTALALLWAHGIPWDDDLPPVAHCPGPERDLLRQQLARQVNTLPTSSMGRLFDTAAALMGLRQTVDYEAQAAMQLEACAAAYGRPAEPYPFALVALGTHRAAQSTWQMGDTCPPPDPRTQGNYPLSPDVDPLDFEVDPAPLLAALLADRRRGVEPPQMAARFHAAVAEMVAQTAQTTASATGLEAVALGGGVFQNVVLLQETLARLRAAGLQPLVHRRIPPNDGGLALGQALVAHARLASTQP